jgi:hypothetical protein
MVTLVALLGVAVAGWGLGRSRRDADVGMVIITVFAAVTAHSAMQFAFVDGRLDQVLGDPRRDAPAATVVLIAAGEAIGLWLPVALVPWARGTARCWGALYTLAAATVAAAYHYAPFDLVVVSDEFLSHDGPPYLLAVFACLPLAGVGFLAGRLKSLDDLMDSERDV